MRRARLLVVVCCVLGASAASLASAPAAFGDGAHVVADCNAHGRLTRHYTVAELRNALATMSADVKEYTDCYDVIQRALLAGLGAIRGGGDGPGTGSGGSFLPTPLIALLVLLALAATTLGAVAVRRRGRADPS